MPLQGEYEPSPSAWVRNQVALSEGSKRDRRDHDERAPRHHLDHAERTTDGKIRKTPLMRVEHDGGYAVVASKGGAPEHPLWFTTSPTRWWRTRRRPVRQDMTAHEATGRQRALWLPGPSRPSRPTPL